MTNPTNLDEALLALQADPPEVLKNKDGQAGNQKTRYADLVQVHKAVLTRLNSYGVIWVCRPTLLPDGKFVLSYKLKHIASGTEEAGDYPLKLSENSQQMGSAVSYSRRYALLAVTGTVAEDEDDDGAGGRGAAQRTAKRATPEQQGQVAQRRPSGPPLPADNRLTDQQLTKIQATFRDKGLLNPEKKKTFMEDVIKHPLASTKDLTKVEAAKVIDSLEKLSPPAGEA